ncbi:DUF1428 domain-containing protein [Alteromonas ponticola]|uniref:DUF1428 domain-containing protein n=1 Tax=Alteromonas ponticola TaxID=2720613 RepID=A0ABX1R5T9_9ALTE|nr:DUF1428 domain-containing protein [Alteromonas ponticola]NMH61286.1 DUF1428 domain-containing protein [Alteromonas ponticola]
MSYVDGFVVAVPNDKKQDYIDLAQSAAKVFKRCGATNVVECWADNVPDGKLTSLPMAVKCQQNESVVFSWVRWPSKEVQESGMKEFMQDPICNQDNNPMPFDGKRMIFGSFNVILDE